MTWRKEQIITVLCTSPVSLHLHISSVVATALGRWESGFSHPSASACSHVQEGTSSLKVTVNHWGKRSNCKGGKSAFFVLTFPAWTPSVASRLTLCPVLLSVKWGNNATSSACWKNYISNLENALEMENAGILPEEVISHAFGWLFSFFFFSRFKLWKNK